MASVALGMMHASSRQARIPTGELDSMRSMVGCSSSPKLTKDQSISSRAYSSCSRTNMWWLKNCWSFCARHRVSTRVENWRLGRTSFVRLIQSCSNPLTSKISNPAISSTPMNVFVDGLPNALLILVTMDPKFFSYSDLASAANSSTTCFVVRAWTTHSFPALTLGRTRALRRSEALVMPRRKATFSSCDWSLMNAWSERSPPTTMFPRLRTAERTRKRSSCSSELNPTVLRAS